MKDKDHDQSEDQESQDREGAQVLGEVAADQFRDVGQAGDLDGEILRLKDRFEVFDPGDEHGKALRGDGRFQDNEHVRRRVFAGDEEPSP